MRHALLALLLVTGCGDAAALVGDAGMDATIDTQVIPAIVGPTDLEVSGCDYPDEGCCARDGFLLCESTGGACRAHRDEFCGAGQCQAFTCGQVCGNGPLSQTTAEPCCWQQGVGYWCHDGFTCAEFVETAQGKIPMCRRNTDASAP